MQIALSVALLVFCLLGTRWIGLSHSISHASLQSQTEVISIAFDAAPSHNHNSDVCHLFDALTLAGFVASNDAAPITHDYHAGVSSRYENLFVAQTLIGHYQSRAPPPFFL